MCIESFECLNLLQEKFLFQSCKCRFDVPYESTSTSVVVVTSLTIFSYSQLLSWARYFIQITTFRGTPIGLAILSAGASMLLYHYQNIPLMRELVMKLKRLEYDQHIFTNMATKIWDEVIIGTFNNLLAQLLSTPRLSIFLRNQ